MEILEILLWIPEALGCFLEVIVGIIDISAAFTGYKVVKEKKQRKKALERDEPVPPARPVWPFILLLIAAVFLTSLSVWNILRR